MKLTITNNDNFEITLDNNNYKIQKYDYNNFLPFFKNKILIFKNDKNYIIYFFKFEYNNELIFFNINNDN